MRTFRYILFAALLAGCTGSAVVESRGEAIVNGTAGGDPAVVLVYNTRRGGLCTGSLIGPRLVLTAKHCIQEASADGPVDASEMLIGIGDSINGLTQTAYVSEIRTTPGVWRESSRGGIGSGLIGSDVAVVLLRNELSATPLVVYRENHTSLGGQPITAVGYGQTPSGETGRKYTVDGRIRYVEGSLIIVGAMTCQGDSGGPALNADNEIVGVTSFGGGGCGSGYGAYNAIYPFLDLIDTALQDSGACADDGAEMCDGRDNDCDELVDETCLAVGESCADSSECLTLDCRNTVGGRVCTAPCDPLRPTGSCGPGLYCDSGAGCEGFCVPEQSADMLPIDADCEQDVQCASRFCSDPGDGRQRCLSPCQGGEGMCFAGQACTGIGANCGGCVDESILFASRGLGESCEAPTDCASELCFADGARSYCSQACTNDEGCPSRFHCRDGTCATGPRGEIGDVCVTNADCVEGSFCAARGDQRWCTRGCADMECPSGLICTPAGDVEVCAPELGIVGDPCAVAEDCLSGLCADTPRGSVCTRWCGPDVVCSAGFECQLTNDGMTGVCLEPDVPVEATSGCSTSVVGERFQGSAAFAFLFAVLGGVLFQRRRR